MRCACERRRRSLVARPYAPRRSPLPGRLALLALLLLCVAPAASAQINIYQMRGAANYGIYVYNVPNNTHTTVYQPYPVTPAGTNSATLAQRPSDGMLFYVTYTGANNPQLYRFNPATPNVAPVPVGAGLGGTVPSSLRMAFSPSGTLYYLPDTRLLYTINPATGTATSTGVTVGAAITSGGDMAFNAAGTLYVVTSSKALFTVNIGSGAATQIGNAVVNFTPAANATIGLAFNAAGDLLAQTQNPNNIYRIPLPVASNATPQGVLVRAGDGDTGTTGDMASANVPAPSLMVTKTVSAATVYRGGPVSYTITVTNSGTYAVTATVTDNVPASVTGVTWTCAATSPSFCAAANGSGNNINTSATLEPGASATYTVNGTISASAATGTLTNTVTVSPPTWLPDSAPANNTASASTTVNLNANLGVTKTDGLTNVNPGSTVTYTVVVSNAGPDTSNGSVFTDTVPAALTSVSWTCGSPMGGATCGAASGTGNNISTTANLPSGGSVTYTITGTLSTTATGTLSNTARVVTPASGVTDPNDPTRTGANNNSATDTTTINTVPNLRIAKTHTGNFTVGINGTYTLTASNTGNGPTSGTITVTDNLPTGLTVASVPTGTGWNCSATVVGSSTATCTSATVIAAGATSPNPITLTVVVSAAAFAASPVTNVANISGGGEPAFHNGDNSASDPTTVNGAPDLTVAKSHTGNFTRGTTGVYTITVTNSGTAVTSGAVTVTDTLPTGLTVASVPTGTGWDCSATVVGGTAATCTRSNALGVGASYPAISLTVNVAQNAAASVTNAAAVSGGGENNTGNNSASDPTTVVSSSDLSLAKVVSNAGAGVGTNATFTLTLTNAGPSNATNLAVTDQLPAGLTYSSATPSVGTYNGTTGVWTVPALASGASATLQLVATINLVGPLTNTAQVTASDQPDPDSTPNNNNPAEDDQASASLNVAAPNVTLCKTVVGQPCPPPALPAQPPGTEISYVINFANTGGSMAQSFIITDPSPPPVSTLKINDYTYFKVGSVINNLPAGLTLIDVRYSSDAAVTWTYTPVSGAGGAPAGYDANVTHIQWRFGGQLSPASAGDVRFTVLIK